jgi:hypothetical protein
MAALAGILIGSAGRAAGSNEYSVSAWSAPVSNLVMRLTCLRNCKSSPRCDSAEQFDFFAKCEIRNDGPTPAAAWQHARLWLVDEAGQTNKCLHYDSGVYKMPVLQPGATTTWWQHGVVTKEGAYKLYACWEGNPGLQTQPVPVAIAHAGSGGDVEGGRRRILQLHAAEFPTLVPNTNLAAAAFTDLVFTNNPVIIRGLLYQAFRFVMPDAAGDLRWAMVLEQPPINHINWYIIPEQGTMTGFETFDTEPAQIDYPGIAHVGDNILVQSLSREHLVPGKRYILWLHCQYRDIPSVRLSLNILDRGISSGDLLAQLLPADPQQTGPRTSVHFEHNGSRRVIRHRE